MSVNVDNLSYADLQKLKNQIEGTLVARQEQEKQVLKNKIRQLAKENGTTIEELFGLKGGKKGGAAKVAVKYRNPANSSETWTGRGRAPKWLQAKLDAGAKKEQFLIK